MHMGVDEPGNDVAPRHVDDSRRLRRRPAGQPRRSSSRATPHRPGTAVRPTRRSPSHPSRSGRMSCLRSLARASRSDSQLNDRLCLARDLGLPYSAFCRRKPALGISTPLQRYQLATVRYGRHGSASAWQSRGAGQFGQAVVVCAARPALPGRPRVGRRADSCTKIKNISAVQTPIPLTDGQRQDDRLVVPGVVKLVERHVPD